MNAQAVRAGRAAKLAIACVSLLGVGVDFGIAKTLGSSLNSLAYFTVQSNLIVAAVCLYGAFARTKGPAYAALRAGATLWILVTGLVFAAFLASHFGFKGLRGYSNIALHYVVPIAVLLDWLLLEPKGTLRLRHALYWIAYPFAYVVASLLRGAIDRFYPYWFLDPTRRFPEGIGGYGTMALFVLGLFIFFGALGLGLVGIDRALASRGAGTIALGCNFPLARVQ